MTQTQELLNTRDTVFRRFQSDFWHWPICFCRPIGSHLAQPKSRSSPTFNPIKPHYFKRYGRCCDPWKRLKAKLFRSHELDFIHRENNYNDFKREIMLPHMLSTLGPKLRHRRCQWRRTKTLYRWCQGSCWWNFPSNPIGWFCQIQ